MKSKIIGTVAVGVMSLAVVGTVVVNSFIGNDENSSYAPIQSIESEVARMEVSTEKPMDKIDPNVESINDNGWHIYDLSTIEWEVDETDFLKVTEFRKHPEMKSVWVGFTGIEKDSISIEYAPTKAKIKDEFGNMAKLDGWGERGVDGHNIDLSSKKFTVTLEFAERDDVTIEITLP